MTRFRLYLLLLGGLLVLYGVAEYYRPRPTDWTHTYINRDKIPFGTYALVDLLPDLFGQDVKITREAVFNQLEAVVPAEAARVVDNEPQESVDTRTADPAGTAAGGRADSIQWRLTGNPQPARTNAPINYLFVAEEISLDSLDVQRLLNFVAAGHHVFIAAQQVPKDLLAKLHLRAIQNFDRPFMLEDSTDLRLMAGATKGQRYRYSSSEVLTYLRQDTAAPTTLRTLATRSDGLAVLVRAPFGYGDFTICTVPAVFGNYYVLRPATAGFAFTALAQLPKGPVWWDEYQKQGREGNQSMLRVIYRHEALRYAFYLTLIGSLMLLWIGVRRRQRIIPIIRPLPNNTLQFVSTVATLYRQGDNHALIAHRKAELFLDFLRNRYQEKTDELADEPFRQRLSQKMGVTRSELDGLLRRLTEVQHSDWIGDDELLQLSALLNRFRK